MRTQIYGIALAALLASCEQKSEIKVYRVSKAPLEEAAADQQNAMPTNAGSPAAPGGMAQAGAPPITAPSQWEPQPLSQMRQASFLVKGDHGAVADISLVTLGVSAGDILENVNRWLSQLEQPPINQAGLEQIAQRLTTSLGEAVVVDLAGLPKGADPAKDGRIIAAMARAGDATLFFKIRGNSALTEAQKADFIKWVAAVCNGQPRNKAPETDAMSPPNSESARLTWKLPEGWTEVPASSMRYASFAASASNGSKVDVSIVTFPGEGGTDADNVNRWRQQIGLAPEDDSAVASSIVPLKNGDTTFSTIDIAGASARTVAAWTRRDGRVWFFKATGPSGALEEEKPKFVKFVQSVRF